MDDDDAMDAAVLVSMTSGGWILTLVVLVAMLCMYDCERNANRSKCERQHGTYTHVGKQWLCVRGDSPFIDLEAP